MPSDYRKILEIFRCGVLIEGLEAFSFLVGHVGKRHICWKFCIGKDGLHLTCLTIERSNRVTVACVT